MNRLLFSCYAGLISSLLAIAVARAEDKKGAEGVAVDKEKRTITIDCKIAPRKIDDPRYKQIYPIEVIACYPFPRGQKAHETIVTMECKPSKIHKAIEELGLKPGTPVSGGGKKDVPKGPEVNILLEIPGPDGKPKKVSIYDTLLDPKTGKKLNHSVLQWRFTGSVMSQLDPNNPEKTYGADLTGTLTAIF